MQAIWLRVKGCVFGVQGDVCFGAVYINPQTTVRGSGVIRVMYDTFMDEAARAANVFQHVLIGGDFNAHKGTAASSCMSTSICWQDLIAC